MILSSELLPNWDTKKMNLDEQISKRVDKQMLNQLVNENVKPFHCENALNTKIKQN